MFLLFFFAYEPSLELLYPLEESHQNALSSFKNVSIPRDRQRLYLCYGSVQVKTHRACIMSLLSSRAHKTFVQNEKLSQSCRSQSILTFWMRHSW